MNILWSEFLLDIIFLFFLLILISNIFIFDVLFSSYISVLFVNFISHIFENGLCP